MQRAGPQPDRGTLCQIMAETAALVGLAALVA
jgi:hypothetical protein